MHPIPKLLLIASFLLPAPWLSAQNPCADYHKFNCLRSTEKRFQLNGQSRSAPVQVGKETEMNIIIYRGQDYRISVCHDARILGEQLAIRLVEKIRVPKDGRPDKMVVEPILDENGVPTGTTREVRVEEPGRAYIEIEKVIWDNTAHDMVQEIEFSCTATKRIAIEINAPGGDGSKLRRNERNFDIGCVGILIEHMTTPDIGF
jgi:hypothetical protein